MILINDSPLGRLATERAAREANLPRTLARLGFITRSPQPRFMGPLPQRPTCRVDEVAGEWRPL